VKLRHLASANYAAELVAGAHGTVDGMIVCALIEARSHERFVLLAGAVDDARLRGLYEDLLEAERRHGELYLDLAEEAAGGDVSTRIAELAALEARVIARRGQPVRMHAGGVS
jgi:tRNA-(ms[2]io[6]A)-hydroxylase